MKLSFTLIFIHFLIAEALEANSQVRAGTDYLLPKNFMPYGYRIHVKLLPEAFTKDNDTFLGQVMIHFHIKNATNYIALHADPNFVKINRIIFGRVEIEPRHYSVNNTTDILRINLTYHINPGQVYIVVIDYTGIMSTTDMYGVYKSSYRNEEGDRKYIISTMLSATYARRAFPCFDEPALKSRFEITIMAPHGLNVFSNAVEKERRPDVTEDLTIHIFNKTPAMSTYLIAFVVSDFTCSIGPSMGKVLYRVCSRNGTARARDVALKYGPPLIDHLSFYTGIEYGSVMKKMDQVALWNLAPGAMENWGLIIYKESQLLWEHDSSNSNLQNIIIIMAHELTHQWFGNLVTLKWWSEIFMNEGFATYLSYLIANKVVPNMELEKQFVVDEMHTALISDSMKVGHPLQDECYTPVEINARYSFISYSKGGSIFRMMDHFMGRDNFTEGLQKYLQEYQFRNADSEDLWRVLNSTAPHLPYNISVIMENWVKKTGYPLLDVTLSGDEVVTISQRKFDPEQKYDPTKWYVPISYTVTSDLEKFKDTSPKLWLTPLKSERIILPNVSDWIILNNQQTGFYRVNYDIALSGRIATALNRKNFDGIIDLNRAQIVDDLFNLAAAGIIRYSTVFHKIDFLSKDTSYYPWKAAFLGFETLLERVGEDTALGQKIMATVSGLIQPLYKSCQISDINKDDQIYTLKQILTLPWACKLGNENCIQTTSHLFNKFKSTGIRPDKNFRFEVYCNALRYSNNTEDWDFLWDTYMQNLNFPSEKALLIKALGCTRNENTLKRYLKKSITVGSGISKEDIMSVFSSVYTGSPKGVDIAFNFLIDHIKIVKEKMNPILLEILLLQICNRFTAQDQLHTLRHLLTSGGLKGDLEIIANEAYAAAESNLKLIVNLEDDLLTYFKNKVDRVAGSCAWVMLMSFSFYIFFFFI